MSEALLVSYAALWALVLAIAVGLLALYRHFGEMYLTSREGRVTQDPRSRRHSRPPVSSGWMARACNSHFLGRQVSCYSQQPTAHCANVCFRT